MIEFIKEDYCSPHIAKLLKSKGFNDVYSRGDCTAYACTHQMARKWLLQKHELFICVMQTLDLEGNVVYVPAIWKNAIYVERACKDKNAVFKSDKDAVEMALDYCLTELI